MAGKKNQHAEPVDEPVVDPDPPRDWFEADTGVAEWEADQAGVEAHGRPAPVWQCATPGCQRPAVLHRLCDPHYDERRRGAS